MIIYITQEWKGNGKQEYYWNTYCLEGSEVVKYQCWRKKIFNGHENEWHESEEKRDSWSIYDPNMPDWLKPHVQKML